MKQVFYAGSLALILLSGCTGPVIMGGDAAVMYASKPSEPPPPDTSLQIPQHQTWCYETMGEPQCYAHPQDVVPDRLIMVDPPSQYPVDLHAYHNAVIEGQ